jgi:phenol 2-monooxygenase
MQYHLDGFHPGDPEVSEAAAGRPMSDPGFVAPVDVLIVGTGPAGLTLAAQLAAFPDITTRIVERRPGPMDKGQADGIACRTMEMFNAFGFAEKIARAGLLDQREVTFWNPDEADRSKYRAQRPYPGRRGRLVGDFLTWC